MHYNAIIINAIVPIWSSALYAMHGLPHVGVQNKISDQNNSQTVTDKRKTTKTPSAPVYRDNWDNFKTSGANKLQLI